MKVNLDVIKPRGCGRTDIEWADYTANPIRAVDRKTGEVGWGCRKCSPGCANCYAADINNRFGTRHPFTAAGLAHIDQVLDEGVLQRLMTFRPRGPFKNGRGRPIVFLGDMMDLFYGDDADRAAHEAVRERAIEAAMNGPAAMNRDQATAYVAFPDFAPVPFEMIDQILAVAVLRPDIDFLILTKRPGRAVEYFNDSRGPSDGFGWHFSPTHRRVEIASNNIAESRRRDGIDESNWNNAWPLPNVWLGASCEDQAAADERIPHLLRCPAAVRFLSCEPLIGAVDLSRPLRIEHSDVAGWIHSPHWYTDGPRIDWVIVGGESGKGARLSDVSWHRSLRDQCRAAGVPFYEKQLGERAGITVDETVSGKALKNSYVRGCGFWPVGNPYADENDWILKIKDRKGGDPSEWPEDLRVREMPGGHGCR
jgi:protein gp37